MEPTTGLILRRITQTNLSVAAHKLATLILDAIAWKDGYNGLSRGTAAVALPLNRLCLNLCGGGAAFLPSTVLARLGRTWRV